MPRQTKQSVKIFILIAAMVLALTSAACNSQKTTNAAAPAGGDAAKPAPQSAPGTPQTSSAPATASAPASPCDSAANPKRCFFSDPFTVTIVNVDHILNSYHTIRLNLEFHNTSGHPIAIAYHGRTSRAVDDLGNAYSGRDEGVTGMPTDFGANTDPRFTLQPNEARIATFDVIGYRTPKDPASFNYDLTIDELGPDKPWPVLREHAIFFREVTPAMPGRK